MSSLRLTVVDEPLPSIRSRTPSELALHGLPLAVQKIVQLNWVASWGTSSLPVPGSWYVSIFGVQSVVSSLQIAPGNASLLNSSGMAPLAAFGASLETAVAVTDTSQVGMPMIAAKLLRCGFVMSTTTPSAKTPGVTVTAMSMPFAPWM